MKIWNEPMIAITRLKKSVGERIGSVTCRKRASGSRAVQRRRLVQMLRHALQARQVDEHRVADAPELMKMKTHIAVSSSVSHPGSGRPSLRSSQFTPPNEGLNSQSHSIAVATPETTEGR